MSRLARLLVLALLAAPVAAADVHSTAVGNGASLVAHEVTCDRGRRLWTYLVDAESVRAAREADR